MANKTFYTASKNSAQRAFPLGAILTIIFVLAQIFGLIHWSWLWVFSPLWLPFAFVMCIVIVVALVVFFASLIAIMFGG